MKPMTTEEEYRNACVPMPKGPNDLEEIIRVLETRNEYLHKHIEKLTEEVHMLREDNVMLAKQIDDKVRKMREVGAI